MELPRKGLEGQLQALIIQSIPDSSPVPSRQWQSSVLSSSAHSLLPAHRAQPSSLGARPEPRTNGEPTQADASQACRAAGISTEEGKIYEKEVFNAINRERLMGKCFLP